MELAILPLREGALFPKAVMPLTLGRPGGLQEIGTAGPHPGVL